MGYESYDGPSEEQLLRRQLAAERLRHKQDSEIIERLLWELKPEDATQELFTWAQMKEWEIKRRRKRDGQ
jgi:hypothetical protein